MTNEQRAIWMAAVYSFCQVHRDDSFDFEYDFKKDLWVSRKLKVTVSPFTGVVRGLGGSKEIVDDILYSFTGDIESVFLPVFAMVEELDAKYEKERTK